METEKTAQPLLLSTREGGVATLRMNRPEQFNPLSADMLTAMQAELDCLADDPQVRCVVITASGKAFCAGHDLRQMQENRQLDYYRDLFAQCSKVMQSIQAMPVPVIARVNGVATAAGCQLVGSCDLAVADESARFAVSGINVGLFCSTPAVALSRNVAPKRAFDMLFTARFIDAATAAQWGLINEAVPAAQLDAAVARLTDAIAAKSPAAVRYGKSLFYRQLGMATPQAYELACDVMARNMMEEDTDEGIDAFFSKRAPRWKSL